MIYCKCFHLLNVLKYKAIYTVTVTVICYSAIHKEKVIYTVFLNFCNITVCTQFNRIRPQNMKEGKMDEKPLEDN
jgi:hypothetical protein